MINAIKKIGLLHHLGGGNLGDDASLQAVMHNIKARWPYATILGFTMNPNYTERRHGISGYAIRRDVWTPFGETVDNRITLKSKAKDAIRKYPFIFRLVQTVNAIAIRMPCTVVRELLFLARSFRIIRSFDLLVITGGGQLLDSWGGSWSFPYTIFKWTLLAKLSGAKCYFVNLGAGPLRHSLAKRFIKGALFLADYASFRDDQSRVLINDIGYNKEAHVRPDSVYSFEIPALITSRMNRTSGRTVGISPMAYCDPRVYWDKNKKVYDSFIHKLVSFGSWLLRNRYSLVLFSTESWFDSQAIEDLKSCLTKEAGPQNSLFVRHKPITSVNDLLCDMSSMDYIVACRFHGIVFAHLLNKPVLSIAHHPKVATLMSDIGLSRYCVDILSCDCVALTTTFNALVNDRNEIKRRMAATAARWRQELTAQFDALFPPEKATEYTLRATCDCSDVRA